MKGSENNERRGLRGQASPKDWRVWYFTNVQLYVRLAPSLFKSEGKMLLWTLEVQPLK